MTTVARLRQVLAWLRARRTARPPGQHRKLAARAWAAHESACAAETYLLDQWRPRGDR